MFNYKIIKLLEHRITTKSNNFFYTLFEMDANNNRILGEMPATTTFETKLHLLGVR